MHMRIGELARRTGVEAGTLRAWERRFGLLSPSRSHGGQRQYSEADVERVHAVRRLVDEGLTVTAAVRRVVGVGDRALPSEAESLLLHQIVENLEHGIVVGKDARPRYANRRAAQMLGCSVEELRARSFLDFIPENDLPLAKERLAGLRQGVTPEPFDQQLCRPDGTTITVESNVRPMFDRAGRYEGSVSIFRDVTEQRATEAENRFRAALLDSVGEALMATTADDTVAYMNQAAETLSGWKAEDVVGGHVATFPMADGAAEIFDEIRARIDAGQSYAGEVPMLHRDGSVFPAHFTVTPVIAPDGRAAGRVLVIRDLTEQRQAEDELRTRQLRGSAVAVLGARALAKGRDSASSDDTLLHETVDTARRLLGTDRAALYEVQDDAALSLRSAVPHADAVTVPPGSGSLPGFTVLARTPVVVQDVALERRFDCGSLVGTTRSAIAAPVLDRMGVRGVLVAESSTPRPFDDAATDFMQSMANVVGAAVM